MNELRGHLCARPADIEAAGAALAGCVQAGDLIGLAGDLGAGKTLLVQALARGLRLPPEVRVTSPTFTLINEYHGGSLPLYHADLYRLEREVELDQLGLDEITRRGDGVVCVEWCDRFPVLGRDHLEVRIGVESTGTRAISAFGGGPRSRALSAAWAAALATSAVGSASSVHLL